MISNISVEQIREVALKAKAKAQSHGIAPDEIDLVAATMAALDLMVNGGNVAAANQSKSTAHSDFPETFAEWADHFNLETNYDRLVAIAVYLRDQKGTTKINTESVSQMFDKARWSKPKNLADTFGKSAQKRYFVEAEPEEGEDGDTLKAWQLTRTGYDYLQTLRKEN